MNIDARNRAARLACWSGPVEPEPLKGGITNTNFVVEDKGERFVTMVTAALAIWNVGIAFVVGVTAYWLNKKGLLRV